MILSEQAIRDTANNGAIAVITVFSTEIELPGTRSQRTRITAKLVRTLHGTTGADGATVQLVRYSSGNDTILQPGKSYVVAALALPRWAPALELVDFVPVDPADAAAVEANAAAVKKALAKQE